MSTAAKKGGAAPKRVSDEAQATELIQAWMEAENKPVTAQSMTDALGSRVGKTLVLRTLEELLSTGYLVAKDLKKVRFYYLKLEPSSDDATAEAAQASEGVPTRTAEEEARREELLQAVTDGTNKARQLTTELDAIMREPTSCERAATLASLRDDLLRVEAETVAHKRQHQSDADADGGCSTEDLEDAAWAYYCARFLWRQRKEYATTLMDAVLGDSGSPAEHAERFGLTTDEDVGVSMQQSAVALPPALMAQFRSTRVA